MPTPCSNDLRGQIVWLVSDIQKLLMRQHGFHAALPGVCGLPLPMTTPLRVELLQ